MTWKRIVLAACLVGMAFLIHFIFSLRYQLDPQGDSNSACMTFPLKSVANASGMEVTGHVTVCDSMFLHDSATYIYLHRQEVAESPRSLVFRFSDDPYAGSPVIKWINSSRLIVSIDSVELVTKQVPSYKGVWIEYSIGREKESREAWTRGVQHLKRMMIASGSVTVVLLMLAAWLWLLIRADMRASASNSGSAPGR